MRYFVFFFLIGMALFGMEWFVVSGDLLAGNYGPGEVPQVQFSNPR